MIPLTSFDLFCAYWLGIGDNNTYRKPNVRDVALRFDCTQSEIESALKFCGLDSDTIKKSGFEMSFAQLDISVAPEGIDKGELAKGLYEELREVNPELKEWIQPKPPEPEPEPEDLNDDDRHDSYDDEAVHIESSPHVRDDYDDYDYGDEDSAEEE